VFARVRGIELKIITGQRTSANVNARKKRMESDEKFSSSSKFTPRSFLIM
jgi:hypothetical protein